MLIILASISTLLNIAKVNLCESCAFFLQLMCKDSGCGAIPCCRISSFSTARNADDARNGSFRFCPILSSTHAAKETNIIRTNGEQILPLEARVHLIYT
jgi:hypothetical protein